MTDKEREEAALAFINKTLEDAPEVMKGEHIVALCHALIVDYADNGSEAAIWTMEIAMRLREFYLEQIDEDCQCPACVAERKANAH